MTDDARIPPTAPGPTTRHVDDEQHLKILSILYYVCAGLNILGVCAGLMYVALGGVMLAGSKAEASGDEMPEGIAWLFGGFGVFVLVLSVIGGILLLFAAINLGRHRARTYCLVVAGLACLSVPLGTVLGIFTIMVLMRPSVKARFEANAVGAAS